jgi:hypothetical protein
VDAADDEAVSEAAEDDVFSEVSRELVDDSVATGAPPHPPEHETEPASDAHNTNTRALTSA